MDTVKPEEEVINIEEGADHHKNTDKSEDKEETSENNSFADYENESTSLLPQVAPVRPRSNRVYWADCARIFSMIGIIMLHSSGYGCEQNLRKKKDPKWKIICCYNCFTRFGVPIKAGDFIKLFVVGEEYLWFIYMIIGCYMISPFLRLFSDNIVLARYFLGLCLFWGSLVPTLRNIFTSYKYNNAKNELDTWTNRWHFHFTLGFVGYFVAGYHLMKHVTIKNIFIRIILYVFGIADAIAICYFTISLEVIDKKKYSKDFRDTYTLTIAIYSIILFIFFKHEIGRIKFSEKAIKIISKLSSLTFGMYLSHMIIKTMLPKYIGISQTKFFSINYSPVIGVPIFCIIITILSLLISYVLSIIPILNRYVL
ncbi:hypothetical protein LY90DRAFT_675769 [Neocallimastix californiae]|uniref:Acyltransferase 3 domain-containing protein n=1 Tax=Neocallimastix californiae TaxID=1754190 RepID=A0A1Y2AJI7_9FUNG|nr:hypothetical protein LY90DRAFT_675769 [Neocallimastix californiae]|eukprot:ORY22728.1 hypothetical protein LY90DRAFT_675769 [Neocallimastix californiae]